MRLEIEGRSTIIDVRESQVRSMLAGLRSYGPSSFASLTDEGGNFVQVAGGGVTCMLERHDASTGQYFRAFQEKKNPVFADGTILVFGGGQVSLAADEWFTAADAIDLFLAFLSKQLLPDSIKWRDVTSLLTPQEMRYPTS